MNTKPVCNFNCICSNSDCSFRHYVSYKERKTIGKIYNDELFLFKQMKEDKNESRKANCIYGQLCKNKDCNFKHHINYDGRMILIEKYTNPNKKIQQKEHKEVKVLLNIKKTDFKSENLFDNLEENKEDTKEVSKVPSVVVIKQVDDSKTTKWTDVVKNGEQMILEKKKIDFEKLMLVEKSAWADYDDE